MDLYDAVRNSEILDDGIAEKLGFKSILVENSDFSFSKNPGNANGNIVAFSDKAENLGPYLKNGCAAIVPQSADALGAMKKYFKDMKDYDTAIVIDVSAIEKAYGTYRALLMGKAYECVGAAKRYGIGVGIATLASNADEMLSSIQLIAMGGLLGLDEKESKSAIALNRNIFSRARK